MKISNLFLAAITLLSVSAIAPAAEAGVDYELTEEYENHRENFFSGKTVGTGTITRFIKRSLCVEEYNPPHYIISVEQVILSAPPNDGRLYANHAKRIRYKYDWNTKKAYQEFPNRDGTKRWEEIISNFRYDKKIANDIFKLAYNMDFFSPAELK